MGTQLFPDAVKQGIRGQRTGCHDDMTFFRNTGNFSLMNRDVGMSLYLFGYHGGKGMTVHRQCAASLHTGGIRTGQNQAAGPAQLLLQQPRCGTDFRTAQGIGAA